MWPEKPKGGHNGTNVERNATRSTELKKNGQKC